MENITEWVGKFEKNTRNKPKITRCFSNWLTFEIDIKAVLCLIRIQLHRKTCL